MHVLSENTVNMIDGLTRSLSETGAIPRSERKALLSLMREHTPAVQGARAKLGDSRRGYTVADVCAALSLSRSTVLRMLRRGELRGHYLRPGSPKTLRIDAASMEAVLCGVEVRT